MWRGADLSTLTFAEPLYLWLAVVPGCLLLLWLYGVLRLRREGKRYVRARVSPVRERFGPVGDLAFWVWVIAAATLTILAIARPQARMPGVRRNSADIIFLVDGSASMYTRDVAPDRWRRSVRFLRTFADSLGWTGDRVALALFAHRTSPQLRLTKDPNALFFFLDHLADSSPFRLEDDPTWDTNIEEGIRWALRLVETDERLFGASNNPKALVVITDGQAWSGSVQSMLQAARQQEIAVHVVGVGTVAGGVIPYKPLPGGVTSAGLPADIPAGGIRSALDRDSLRAIAQAGGGQYFEMGQSADRYVAAQIIANARGRERMSKEDEVRDDLYPLFLLAAAVCLCLGVLFLRRRTELWWQAAVALVTVLMLSSVLNWTLFAVVTAS